MAADKTAAPAPAAPPQPAPAPAPSNAAPVPQTSVDEDTQIIEDLRKEHFAKNPEKPKAKEADPEEIEVDVELDDEPEEEPAKGKDGKSSKPPTPPSARKAPKYKSGDDAVAAIVKAVESGDPKAIAKALGKPDNFLEVNNHKWVAFRQQRDAIKQRERVVTEREQAFNGKLAEAKKEYSPLIEAAAAYREGKYDRFVDLVEHLTGDKYDEATRKVIKGETTLSPEVRQLKKELAELRAERLREKKEAEEQTRRDSQQEQYRRAVAAVSAELASHPVAKMKGFQRLVLEKVRESHDGHEFTMSFEEAADAIVDERLQEARHFTRGRQLPAAREEPAPRVPPRRASTTARAPDGDEWLQRDLSEEELVASIERDYKSGRIKPV